MVQKPRQIIKMVEIKRIKFIGYVTQYNKFIINNIMKGKINEKEEKDDREIQIQKKQLSLLSYETMKRFVGKK